MRFYVLEPEGLTFGTRWAYVMPVDPVHYADQGNRCPVCDRPVGPLYWLPPYRVQLSSAKPEKWGDLVWGTVYPFLVSERLKAMMEQEQLTGLSNYRQVEVVRVGKRKTGDLPEKLPPYYTVDVLWNGANMDDAASEVVRKPHFCSFCRGSVVSYRRVVLEDGSWVGVDLFEARGQEGVIMASERFVQAARDYGLRNVWAIPATLYAYDEHRPGLWYVREE